MVYQKPMVCDLTVECEGQTQTFVVGVDANTASTSTLTIACSPEAIAAELRAIVKRSKDAVACVDSHKATIEAGEHILAEISPWTLPVRQETKESTALKTRWTMCLPLSMNIWRRIKKQKTVRKMWNDFDKYRDDAMMRDFESDDPEKAYREGLKKGRKQGYRKAMEEVEERSRGYGERGGYGMRDGRVQR